MRNVLLFSTGMDSYILSQLEQFDTVLFLLTGTTDNQLEYTRLQSCFMHLAPTVVDVSFLKKFELPNKIIPFRNHIFSCIAAMYGHQIFLAATAGDTTRDKDEHFADTMSQALRYFATGPENKVSYPGTRQIRLPFKQYTKTEIVAQYLSCGFPAEDLIHKSTSCYEPTHGATECGRCRACLRKFVALYLNGLRPAFKLPTIECLQQHLVECQKKGRAKEEEETRRVVCMINE